MIPTEKAQNALYALNTVLVLTRAKAHKNAPGTELAQILDVLEYLPRLLAAQEDRTEQFREHLADLARRYPEFDLALRRFDQIVPAQW